MNIAEYMFLGAAALFFLDLAYLMNPRYRGRRVLPPLAPIACLLIIGSYVILAKAFVEGDFRYAEVYSYSSSGLPTLSRIYASWASSAGSWLFLSFLFSIGCLVLRLKMRRERPRPKAFEVLDVLLIFFVLVMLLQSPFRLLPEAPMDGRGLNPLLKTPWMFVHPPVVFTGYVLVFFAYAFSFDSVGSGAPAGQMLTRAFSQMAWFFLTLGIALGGLWAYEVLGWGGYWSWDPVETASLIPWITLTAYFHLTPAISSRGTDTREFMVAVTSALVILAMAITRGGMAVSVHAFGTSPVGFVLLLLVAFSVLYFIYHQRKGGSPLFEVSLGASSVHSSSLIMGFVSLVMIAVVCLWGLLFPILAGVLGGGASGVDAAFFNKWNYPFVLVFVGSLIGCHLSSRLSAIRYAGILIALLATGLGAAFLGFPTSNLLANLGIPFVLFASGAVVYSTWETVSRRRNRIVPLGRNLLHVGVTLVVLGVLIGSSSVTDYGEISTSPGTIVNLGGLIYEFGDFSVLGPLGNVHTFTPEAYCVPEAVGLQIPVVVAGGGSSMRGELKILLYTNHGVVSRPLILRELGRDVYVVLHQSEEVYFSLVHATMGAPLPPSEFLFSVRVFPMLNLLWLGVLSMAVGILLPILSLAKNQ